MASRDYAALPHEYLDEMSMLNDAEFGRLCRALLHYSMTGEETDLPGNERFNANRVYRREDRYRGSYEESAKRRRSAGQAGAAVRWKGMDKDANACQRMPIDGNAILSDGKNGYTETKTETETKVTPPVGCVTARAKRFTPPTVEEVAAYVAERGSLVDPQGFVDFYAAKGWMVGKTPMKDWKAACRNAEKWERWTRPTASERPSTSGNVFLDIAREEGIV